MFLVFVQVQYRRTLFGGMFEHARDSVFCSHHLSRVLLDIVSREWAQDTLDNDSKQLHERFIGVLHGKYFEQLQVLHCPKA